MPHSLSAKKRVRQNVKHRARNRSAKSAVRTQLKSFLATVEGKDAEAASRQFQEAVRVLDRAVTRGVMHRNTVARRKSRLAARLKQLSSPSAPQS